MSLQEQQEPDKEKKTKLRVIIVYVKEPPSKPAEKPFKCTLCPSSFTEQKNLIAHFDIHSEDRPFVCNTCGKGFTRKNHLQYHQKTHLVSSTDCTLCKDPEKGCSNCRKRPERKHLCPLCPYASYRKFYLKEHLRIHSGEKPFACEMCGRAFNQRGALKCHLRTHTGEKPYECDLCGRKFASKGTLNTHQKREKRKILVREGALDEVKKPKTHYCKECPFSTTLSKADLIQHQLSSHAELRPFGCEVCGKTFALKQYLVRHRTIHLKEKPFICKTCGRGFGLMDYLRRHEKFHEQRTRRKVKVALKCNICKKIFRSRAALQKHKQQHPPLKFRCPECPYSTHRKELLQSHLSNRHLEKLQNMNDHSKPRTKLGIHTEKDQIKCPECPFEARSAYGLAAHRRKRHPKNLEYCSVCSACFSLASDLQRHVETMHSVQKEGDTVGDAPSDFKQESPQADSGCLSCVMTKVIRHY